MEKFFKTFLNSYALIGFFTIMGYWLFFKRKKGGDGQSINPKVNDAINILDNAFNRYGTEFQDIKDVFSKLSSSEIKRLYKDFGIRRYNSITGVYGNVYPFELENIVTDLNLRGILEQELDSDEHEIIKKIHESKGLEYPYLG